jgi:hypothetical protein
MSVVFCAAGNDLDHDIVDGALRLAYRSNAPCRPKLENCQSTTAVFQLEAYPMVINNGDVELEGLRCFGDVFLGLRIHSLARKKKTESLGCIQELHAAGWNTVEIAHANFPLRPVTRAIFQ